MNPFLLLPGIAIAAALFCALMWSAARAFRVTGRARQAHIASAALTILGMATISLVWPVAARAIGALLIAASLAAAAVESGTDRLWPLLLTAFGAALATSLPFS